MGTIKVFPTFSQSFHEFKHFFRTKAQVFGLFFDFADFVTVFTRVFTIFTNLIDNKAKLLFNYCAIRAIK